jgi:O-antigen polymerase
VVSFTKYNSLELLAKFLVSLILFVCVCQIPHLICDQDLSGSNKFRHMSFLFAVTIITPVFYIFWAKSRQLTIKVPDLAVAGLLVYVTINKYWFNGFLQLSGNYYELIGLSVVYLILRNSEIRVLIYAICLGGLIQAVIGSLQLMEIITSPQSLFPAIGSFLNPGPFGGYLAGICSAAFFMHVYRSKFLIKQSDSELPINHKILNILILNLPIFTLSAIILILPATNSRAAWLATALGILFPLLLTKKPKDFFHRYVNLPWKRIIVKIGAFFLLTTICIGLYYLKEDSSFGRLFIWKTALKALAKQPLTGFGFDNFASTYINFQADYFQHHLISREILVADDVRYAFNELLQFSFENGMLITVILILLIYLIFRKLDKQDPNVLIGIAGLSSYLIFALFSYPAQILPIKLNVLIFAVLLINSNGKFAIKNFSFSGTSSYSIRLMISFSLFLLSFFCFKHLKAIRLGLSIETEANRLYSKGLFDEAANKYGDAYPILAREGEFLALYGKALTMAKRYEQAVPVLLKAEQHFNSPVVQLALGNAYQAKKDIKKATEHYYRGWYMIPSRIYPKYLLAKMYWSEGETLLAKALATEVLNQPVKIVSPATQQIRNEMQQLTEF